MQQFNGMRHFIAVFSLASYSLLMPLSASGGGPTNYAKDTHREMPSAANDNMDYAASPAPVAKSATAATPAATTAAPVAPVCNRQGELDDAPRSAAETKAGIAPVIPAGIVDPKAVAAAPLVQTAWAALKAEVPIWQKAREKCQKGFNSAESVCLEGCSEDMSRALNAVTMVTTAVNTIGAATSNTCSKVMQAMKYLQMGMTAYQAACTIKRGSCKSVCTGAENARGNLIAKAAALDAQCKIAGCTNPPYEEAIVTATNSDAASKTDNRTVAGKMQECEVKYAAHVASAGAGLAQILMSLMTANSCKKATADVAVVPDTVLDCSLAANAQNQECICLANPRLAGCSTLGTSTAASYGSGFGTENGLTGDGGENLDIGGGDTPGNPQIPASSAGAGSGGSGGMMGGMGGGAGGGSSGEDEAKAAAAGSGLNTNILGTESGGGGRSFGGGSSGLRNYLPGGSKDPQRNVSGGFVAPVGVTGAGGRSNWEKVRSRYIENKTTLLNQ